MKRELQEQRIVEAALEKFRQFGIRRVTMDEIARSQRMSKKTLYTYFSSKEALVYQCTVYIRSNILPVVLKAASEGSAVERFMKFGQVFSIIPKLISGEMLADLKSDYPHIWQEVDEQRHQTINAIEGLINDGKEEGDIWPQVNSKVFIQLLRAILEGVMSPDVLAKGDFSPLDAAGTLFTIFTKGLFISGFKDDEKVQL